MEFYKGYDRILYLKINGVFMPVACLTENPFSESTEFLDTTTRDNNGWTTSKPIMQSYNIAFSGIQINTTVAGGDSTKASYDRLKEVKRGKQLVDWKIQGNFPVVDYGQAYLSDLSEANASEELLSFSGTLIGYGVPLMATLNTVLLNDGDPTRIITDGNNNLIQV